MAGPGRPMSRPRGRLPANWAQRMALQEGQVESVKIPKKRGPKPGSKVTKHTHNYILRFLWMSAYHPTKRCVYIYMCVCLCKQRKPRVVPNPVPVSPNSSMPEPDTSTVPLDNATIPSAALHAATGTHAQSSTSSLQLTLIWISVERNATFIMNTCMPSDILVSQLSMKM